MENKLVTVIYDFCYVLVKMTLKLILKIRSMNNSMVVYKVKTMIWDYSLEKA